ncbi:MAG: hypothetical protein RQ733_09080 [Methyloprofundus sp.]|nr:hypothetical protein [Methyloprofundus sp.]MDT8426113.1 hypothetical protein [Methyloprofundus sp.]
MIANADNPVSGMSKTEIQSLFMGRKRTFANGIKAMPLDFSVARERFYPLLTKRSTQQIDAYWARIIFSGQGMPPIKLSSAQDVLSMVQENQGAIAYIDRSSIGDSQVQVLLSLE